MTRDVAHAEVVGAALPDADRETSGGIAGAIGALYAAVAGLAIGGIEGWADRRAEKRAARSRAVPRRRSPRSGGRGA